MKRKRRMVDGPPTPAKVDELVDLFLKQGFDIVAPSQGQSFESLMTQARKTNATRDTLERQAGFAAPGDDSVWQHLRTAMSAIEAGLHAQDWPCVAEGYVMLEDIERGVRPPDFA